MSIYAEFERTRRAFRERPFLHVPARCTGGPADFTYDEAGEAVEQIAATYRSAGYGAGHHVALLLENRPAAYLHGLALNAIGATLLPIGADLPAAEAAYLLQHGDADLLVHLPERLALAEAAAGGRVPLATAAGPLPPATAPRSRSTIPDRAAIVFTSGSTARPKGCVLSNEYFLSFGHWYRDLGGRCQLRRGEERLITPLPLNHVNALAFSQMGMIMTGGCIIQLDRFRSPDWWPIVRSSRATVMHYLGVMPAMLLRLAPSELDRAHALRFGFGGGVNAADHATFEQRFGVPLIEAWAMTETGGSGTISTHEGPRNVGTGCIGIPSARYAEARIVDEQNRVLPAGEVGELVVYAPGDNPRRGFFAGYYKDEAATEAAWRGGWLHTGDLARRDETGSFYFVGRRKQVIRRSGENISAREVEVVLEADPDVKEVAVVPVPDAVREEEVFACIVPASGIEAGEAVARAIVARAARKLAYYKVPAYVAFVDELPKTATQKLRYGVVGDLARQLVCEAGRVVDLRDAKRSFRQAG